MATKVKDPSRTFYVTVHDAQNVSLPEGSLVQLRWSFLNEEGVSELTSVSAERKADLKYQFTVQQPLAGPKSSKETKDPKLTFLTLALEHVERKGLVPRVLDKLSLNLSIADPLLGRMGICSSKLTIFTIQLSLQPEGDLSGMSPDSPQSSFSDEGSAEGWLDESPNPLEMERRIEEVRGQLRTERRLSKQRNAEAKRSQPGQMSAPQSPDVPGPPRRQSDGPNRRAQQRRPLQSTEAIEERTCCCAMS